MQRRLFDSFYKGNIEKIAKEIASNNEGIEYVPNLNGAYEEYLNQKTALKRLIKGFNEQKDDFEILLDGHKVAACITCAVARVRLLVDISCDDTSENNYTLDTSNRLNEQLAVLSGLSCLLEYMKADDEFLCPEGTNTSATNFIFPKTNYEDRSRYIDSLIRGLYYSNIVSNVNPLLVAHIFFMVEKYHRKCVEFEDFKNQLRKE